MISDLFINACILIAFISLIYIIFKDKNIHYDLSIKSKLVVGIFNGGLGAILILYGVHIIDRLIDFRYIPMILSSLYGGYISVTITAIIICIFRLLETGISINALVASAFIMLLANIFSFISNLKISRKKKWIYCVLALFMSYWIVGLLVEKMTFFIYSDLFKFFLGTCIVAFITYIYEESLLKDIKEDEKIKIQATKDHLTGINNRRGFDNSFNTISKLVVEKNRKLSLLMIDIDFFKKINDTYGHNSGDIVLKELAQLLVNNVRSFDIVSRNGGEEFSILLLDCSLNDAINVAENLRGKISRYKFSVLDGANIYITVSIGVSSYPNTIKDIRQLFEYADKALYEAKESGRDKVISYDGKIEL